MVPTYWIPRFPVKLSLMVGAKPAVAVSKIEATSGLHTIQLHPPRSVFLLTTLRGGCNWIVCSPEVASIFETATAGFEDRGDFRAAHDPVASTTQRLLVDDVADFNQLNIQRFVLLL